MQPPSGPRPSHRDGQAGLLAELEHAPVAGELGGAGPWPSSGLSESFTAGRPSADTTLQTMEKGSRRPSGPSPRKSLVSSVPQP